jgi:hypothetical protein
MEPFHDLNQGHSTGAGFSEAKQLGNYPKENWINKSIQALLEIVFYEYLVHCSCNMVNLVALFFLVITANAVVSPVSLNSDVSIIIHNDLLGNSSFFGQVKFSIDHSNSRK